MRRNLQLFCEAATDAFEKVQNESCSETVWHGRRSSENVGRTPWREQSTTHHDRSTKIKTWGQYSKRLEWRLFSGGGHDSLTKLLFLDEGTVDDDKNL